VADVRVSAGATVLAALIAVVGSFLVVRRSGRQQLDLQRREFAQRTSSRQDQWDEERRRAARGAEIDACVHFDAALVIALSRLRRMVDLHGKPGLRRKLLGRDWAREWNRGVTDAATELAVPYSTVRLSARPAVRAAVDEVASAFEAVATEMSSLPTWVPEPFLVRPLTRGWHVRIETAISEVQDARKRLAEVLEIPATDAS
jgi:hypothetical protein